VHHRSAAGGQVPFPTPGRPAGAGPDVPAGASAHPHFRQRVTMTEKLFDGAFLNRLALVISAIEQEDSDANDPQPLEEEDYAAIYTAYEESGGDSAAARTRIAMARDQCARALAHVVQFIADQYSFGPIEALDDDRLRDVAQDAFDASERWMEDVEMHDGPALRDGPLRGLLSAHYQSNETMFDLHDEILWPLARRISPGD
jgi:hypothetical protein